MDFITSNVLLGFLFFVNYLAPRKALELFEVSNFDKCHESSPVLA